MSTCILIKRSRVRADPGFRIERRACAVLVEDEAMRDCIHYASANGEKGAEAARRTALGIVVGTAKTSTTGVSL